MQMPTSGLNDLEWELVAVASNHLKSPINRVAQQPDQANWKAGVPLKNPAVVFNIFKFYAQDAIVWKDIKGTIVEARLCNVYTPTYLQGTKISWLLTKKPILNFRDEKERAHYCDQSFIENFTSLKVNREKRKREELVKTTSKRLAERLGKERESENADLTFSLEGKPMKAHSGWLNASSPYFKALIEERGKSIEIKNCSYEVFDLILNFLYGKQIEFKRENASILLKAAIAFKIQELPEKIANFIREDFSVQSPMIQDTALPTAVSNEGEIILDRPYKLDPPDSCYAQFQVKPNWKITLKNGREFQVIGSITKWSQEKQTFASELYGQAISTSTIEKIGCVIILKQDELFSGKLSRIDAAQLPPQTLIARVKKLGENKSDCDVAFIVDGKTIEAHAWVLEYSSAYFRILLGGSFKEGRTNEEEGKKVVAISGHSPEVFNLMIESLYDPQKAVITPENVLDLYLLANQFDLPNLTINCAEKFRSFLTIDNSLQTFEMILPLINQFNLNVKADLAVEDFISLNASAILKSRKKICDLSSIESLKAFLSLQMDIEEAVLFESVNEWIKNKEKNLSPQDIQDILSYIRFEWIEIGKFWETVGQEKYFDTKLMGEWSQSISGSLKNFYSGQYYYYDRPNRNSKSIANPYPMAIPFSDLSKSLNDQKFRMCLKKIQPSFDENETQNRRKKNRH